jgi:hypothetical protein
VSRRARRKRHYSAAERQALREKAEGKITPREAERRARGRGSVRRRRGGSGGLTTLDVYYDFAFGGPPFRGRKERADRLREAVLAGRPALLTSGITGPHFLGIATLVWTGWVRPPEEWRPAGKGLTAAYRSLAAHLLGEYPVSPVLWDSLLVRSQSWTERLGLIKYVSQLAQGRSARHLVGTSVLPAPLTRRMLHIMSRPAQPAGYLAHVRRAQVLGHGGPPGLIRELVAAEPGGFRPDEAGWAETVHWFCRQPDLRAGTVGPLVDFLLRRAADGAPLDLKGRTVRSLLRQTRAWHRELATEKAVRKKNFRRSGLEELAWVVKRRVGSRLVPHETWRFTEILTARDLVAEGSAMRHCVATYCDAAADGVSSFWSLTCNGKRRLTLEIDGVCREVRQVRGRANRLPRPDEAGRVVTWAERNGLQVASWEVNKVLGRA